MAIHLCIKDDKGTSTEIGTITEEQLQQLVALLEEESAEDRDYFVDADLLDFLEGEGATDLVALLRPHVTEEDGIEVEWRKD